jgi:hypothetical protein
MLPGLKPHRVGTHVVFVGRIYLLSAQSGLTGQKLANKRGIWNIENFADGKVNLAAYGV